MTISRSISVFAFCLFAASFLQAQTGTTPTSKEKTRGQAPTETTTPPTQDKARPQTQTERTNNPNGKGRPKPHTEDGMKKADDEMAKDLNLSEAQKEKFKQIDTDYKAKMKAAKLDKKADMQKIRAERQAAHKSVLTAEQARKYDEKMAQREAKHEARKGEKQSMKKHGHKPGKENQDRQ